MPASAALSRPRPDRPQPSAQPSRSGMPPDRTATPLPGAAGPRPARTAPAGLAALRAVPDPARFLDRTAFDTGTASDIPPPPTITIQKLALYAFEAVEGTRTVAQLGQWITSDVAAALAERRAARTERRTLYRDARRIVACPGPAHLDRPSSSVIEATVVLYAEPRSRSVALRFEHDGGRWRATELTVL
ncbi:Rv3235 family protein [Leucobacter massiliensis]|uniref:Rv3235 family protein n=1 Tax=Leucobacter massiliensis TaxID=1686285 RepID=UPI0011B22FDA|nr:Rv3235 family protein [Leucobacter massiliensis]